MGGWVWLCAAMVMAAIPAAAQTPPVPPRLLVTDVLPTQAQVSPDGAILLVPGRRLTAAFDAKMKAAAAGEGAAEALTLKLPDSVVEQEAWIDGVSHRAAYEDERLRFTLYSFTQPAGSRQPSTVLMVTNGRKENVVYFAALVSTVGGRRVLNYTTICSVRPQQAGIETWGEAVDGIVIIKVIETKEPVCTDAATGKLYQPGQQPPAPDAAATPK